MITNDNIEMNSDEFKEPGKNAMKVGTSGVRSNAQCMVMRDAPTVSPVLIR